jgi:D-arginine dehydrogenase
MESVDFLIVGAGMAGASAACELARLGSVLLLEQESQPGYHSTGRSAAMYTETYGNRTIRALTTGSKPHYLDPPPGFTDHALLRPRGVLLIARADQAASRQALIAELGGLRANVRDLDTTEASRLVPILRPGYATGAVFDVDAMEIEVHALHQGYLRGLKALGGQLVTDARVERLERHAGLWTAECGDRRFRGRIVVDAAGAWADEVATLAGARPAGLVPKRRTAILLQPPPGIDVTTWPMVIDIDEQFYFKPEAGTLLASPADETPMPPCDIQPDDLDIALLIDRLEGVIDVPGLRPQHRWAGLRTFAPDKTPVVGFDGAVENFFWLAGQGGYGIQTAPAMARLTAALIEGHPVPPDLAALGVRERALSPRRFDGASASLHAAPV